MRTRQPLRATFIGGWSTIHVVAKRIISQPGLILATTLGLIIALALMMSIPLYADATYHRIFLKNIAAAEGKDQLAEDGALPPLTYLFRYDGSIHGAIEWEDVQQVNTYITQRAGADLGLHLQFAVSYFNTNPFGIYASTESLFKEIRAPLIWAGFATISDIENHITLVEGHFPNAASSAPDELVEVLVYQGLASKLGFQAGESYIAYLQVKGQEGTIHDVQIPIRIAGIWEATDPQESFWFFRPSRFEERLIVPEGTFAERLSSQLTGEVYTGVWYLVMEAVDIRQDAALTLLRNGLVVQQQTSGLLTNIKLARSPMEALIDYQHSSYLLTILLYAFSVPILGLLFAFITLTSGMAVERRRNEVAVLRSRGARTTQMIGIAAMEGLLLGVIALVLSAPVGMLIAGLIGQARSFLDFSAPAEILRANMTTATWRFGLIGVGLVILAQVLPTFGASQHTIVSYKREMARMMRKPWWQRMWLDVLLLIPAGYGAYLLRQQGSLVVLNDVIALTGTNPYENPLLFLVPALGIFALTLFFLRLMPVIMAIIAWIAGRTRAVGLLMATRHLARTPGFYTTPLILLVLTLSLSAFTASLAATLDGNLIDQMRYRSGADMEFLDMGEDNRDTSAYIDPEQTSTSDTDTESEGPRWFFLPLSDYQNAPGVEQVTRVGRYPAYARLTGDDQAGIFMGIERAEFSQIAFWRADFAAESLGGLMNALAATRNGVLVPRDFMLERALQLGDILHLTVSTYDQDTDVYVTIVGNFDLFPTWYPSEGPLFVGNLDCLFENTGGQFPYSVWLKTAPDADYAMLGDEALSGQPVDWEAPAVDVLAEQELPERQGLFGLLSVGFAAAAVLTVLGFLLYALFSFRRRFIEFGVLRAVGLSSAQMTAFLGWELAFLILTGGALGTGLGAFVSKFFIPFLQVSVDEASRIPPYSVDIAWSAIFRVYALFGVLFVVALVALVAMLRRMKIFQAIKLGETA
jgi:putative ABC transport system permease protein